MSTYNNGKAAYVLAHAITYTLAGTHTHSLTHTNTHSHTKTKAEEELMKALLTCKD